MRNIKWLQAGAAGVATLALLATVSSPVFADTGSTVSSSTSSTASTATHWTVNAGPMTKSGVMAMSFFPNVITIDAGDSITFEGVGHTVSFPGINGTLPSALSPQAQLPAGGSTYNGSTFTSSGLLMGKPYTLTFTKPGVYPYYCLLHPGMMGVVIVNPAGTPYPLTQAQYNAQAQAEEQADFNSANQSIADFKLKTQKNANGTTTYFAQTDAKESQSYAMNLSTVNNSGVKGSALIAFAQPPSQSNSYITYGISVKLAGLKPGHTYTAMLCEGKSGSGVMVPHSKFATVIVNSDGTGTVTGSVEASGLPQGVWNLDIYNSSKQVVATGLINHPSWAYERFLPDTLNIHTGDTVIWTQTGVNEVHTVTFLPKGWSDIPNESLMPPPYGGHIYAGTGYFNSGFLVPGATYELTFIKSGSFAYRCLLHDVMGMLGTVNVTSQPNVVTAAWNNSVENMPSKTIDGSTYVPIWYLMQLLKSAGIQTSWNGSNWNITSDTAFGSNSVSQASGNGNVHLYVNNHMMSSMEGKVWKNYGQGTMYIQVDDLLNVMKAMGMNPTFIGGTLDFTPSAHAGSIPSVPSGQSSNGSSAASTSSTSSTGTSSSSSNPMSHMGSMN
ncbi:cupredoxin domain-containing protein [Alicyclobacillus tolerans]|uniref:Plastocyanin n=1 Tax=Alicyclobacillus tolerans TaxID=90970 RepID=A0A1M6QQ29_9BACL|nr:plastocyanin/azurin family copper-binding protein [Alicyclobacillus montanus]SHK22389.1 Plastocyanin [Alicyclobacillus montanus]